VAINSTFSTGQVLTAAQVNNLPFGIVVEAGGTATTAYTAGNALTVLTATGTITAGRLYMVHGALAVQASGSATANALYVVVTSSITRTLWYDTTAIGTNLCQSASGFAYMTASDLGVTSGTASRTFNLTWKSGAAGSLNTDPDNYVGAATFQQRLAIFDVGKT
jgi:hypothetical protein